MYNKEQVMGGIVLYIRREVLPILPDYGKVIGGAVLLRNAAKLTDLLNNDIAHTLGLVDKDGNMDVDLWCQYLKDSMKEFGAGKLELSLPLLQPIIINENDVDQLKRYIKGELR